jgi:gluconolactonase
MRTRSAPRLIVSALGLLCATALVATAQDVPHSYPTIGRIIREDPAFDALIPKDAKIEVLASGIAWAEGPAWVKDGGYLVFSDVIRNTAEKWSPKDGLSVFMKPSGYTGVTDYGKEPGSNGITVDALGRLTFCEQGDRRISVLLPNGGKRTLVDNYMGKRLNSPNDLIYNSKGDLYFTDPPYGLPKNWDDPRRELDFCGVYLRKADGEVKLLTKELSRPNGIGLSPDEKTLYVSNSDPDKAIWMAYPVNSDGTIGDGRVLADVTAMMNKLPGSPDGLKVDAKGNLFFTGPGGIYVFSPAGKELGRIDTGERTANCTFGDDGSTLYIAADMYLCRLNTTTKGQGF